MTTHNVFSVSGGKDSGAVLLLGIVQDVENITGAFADTGNEHQLTYDHIDYLEDKTGVKINRVKADFSEEIKHKREVTVNIKWREQGVSEYICDRAMSVLHPTGNPFLDLCLWKGRFPSTKARFCSSELKRIPLTMQVLMPLCDGESMVLSWQGVRRDESENRRFLPECDEVGDGLFNYRPILDWNVSDVFEAYRYMGLEHNPLYTQGMGRVGCMPCIHARKDELLEISKRFPDEVDRVREWESLVSMASKRGAGTFFSTSDECGVGIDQRVEWAKTTPRKKHQYDMFRADGGFSECSSIYGLCE